MILAGSGRPVSIYAVRREVGLEAGIFCCEPSKARASNRIHQTLDCDVVDRRDPLGQPDQHSEHQLDDDPGLAGNHRAVAHP